MSIALGPERVQHELLQSLSPTGTGTGSEVDQKGTGTALLTKPATRTTDMATAVIKALKALWISQRKAGGDWDRPLRIAFVSPYKKALHDECANYFRKRDFPIDIVCEDNFGQESDSIITSIDPACIVSRVSHLLETFCSDADTGTAQLLLAGKAEGRGKGRAVDAVLLCCSAMNTTALGFIERLEDTLGGVPVVTSNQALLWYSLVLCKEIAHREINAVRGYGQLLYDVCEQDLQLLATPAFEIGVLKSSSDRVDLIGLSCSSPPDT